MLQYILLCLIHRGTVIGRKSNHKKIYKNNTLITWIKKYVYMQYVSSFRKEAIGTK